MSKDKDPSSLLTLSIRCFGLHVSSDAVFPTSVIGTRGLVTNFFSTKVSGLTGSGPAQTRNERRYIELSQSVPFVPPGRPASLLYEVFYRSEAFDEVIDISPSLVADIRCPSNESDINIRATVYYSSNKTYGKDAMICSTTFSLRSLLRANGSVVAENMTSEYCKGAKIYLEARKPMIPLFHDKAFSAAASSAGMAGSKSRLAQKYVFYREGDITPCLDAIEYSIEPRLALKVPILFLQQISRSVTGSCSAWEARRLLERHRQSKFDSLQEAFRHGWNELNVTIVEANFEPKHSNDSVRLTAIYMNEEEAAPKKPTRRASMMKREESLPSSFVEAYMDSCLHGFSLPLGRSNTEYHTLAPKYGSNAHASQHGLMAKARKDFTSLDPATRVLRYTEHCGGSDGSTLHEVSTFQRYVPSNISALGARLRFDVYGEGEGLLGAVSASPVLHGHCYARLDGGAGERWLDVVSHEASPYSIKLLVRIDVACPPPPAADEVPIESVPPAPPALAEVFFHERLSSGEPCASSASSTDTSDYREVLSAAYEWLWHVGFTGADPLTSFHGPIAPTLPSSPSPPSSLARRGSAAGSASDDAASFSLEKVMEEVDAMHADDSRGAAADHASARQETFARTDYAYPLEWIDAHVQDLQAYAQQLSEQAAHLQRLLDGGATLRSSASKKDPWLQALPINLHMQALHVRRCVEGGSSASSEAVVDSMTCGSLSPHALGHKKGGLFNLENELLRAKQRLQALCDQYRDSCVTSNRHSVHNPSPAHDLFHLVGKAALAFESSITSIAKRRMLSISQGLSVIANAFVAKLSLVSEGFIPHSTADRWMRDGFFVVFEGLLSVIGHERSMLEDTISTVEVLRLYVLRLLPSSSSCAPAHIDKDRLDLDVAGREIRLYLPDDAIMKLPDALIEKIHGDAAVISLQPILFTQGIDIIQSTANTFSADAIYLQHRVNIRAIKLLNLYCHKVQPIGNDNSPDRGNENVFMNSHPLIFELSTLIKNASFGTKNVEMLMEIERICLILGGCRVTFCKSGKDRTGMAVTLEQSRQLGERFNCGMSPERVYKDANIMRLYGTRILVCEKNVGRKIYSINKIQSQFLPPLYRPPAEALEDIMKKDSS